jgi:SM-20-related protein
MLSNPIISNELKYIELAEKLADNGYAFCDHFIPSETAVQLAHRIAYLFEQASLTKAGIGTASQHKIAPDVRGDYIKWIDDPNEPDQLAFFHARLNEFIAFLNLHYFAGVKDFEMHYTYYPVGTHYKKHIDQLKINGRRMFSFVLYLNDNWTNDNGGKLRIFKENETNIDLEPLAGRLVIFRSDSIPHAVLTVNKPRISITGWMLNQLKDLTFI